MITFDVLGTPAPQGSKRAFVVNGKARMNDMGGKGLASWRDSVSSKAHELAREHGCFDGPLRLVALFRFPMPASRSKSDRMLGCIWRPIPPDSSKLLRALEDALKVGGLIHDDSRIVEHLVRKVEVFNSWSGATVTLSTVSRMPPAAIEIPAEQELTLEVSS